NVRELRNAMERVQALQRGPVVGAADLDLDLGPATGPAAGSADGALPQDWLDVPLPEAVERLERRLIAHALEQARGNRSLAARRLGIHRQLLYSKLAQYGME
ncbi:sigma-54-dependent Fis family transcriptional regulator, partial [Paracidovorax avenae]|uniref:helix-turn-helix domain-containing protein n=1 Tax=Paracidovorax avenae TaxID=80867 RepID=UPI000D21229C